jgi:hypothetical protein
VGALLLAGLLTALVAIISGLVVRFLPAWHAGYLTAACFLVALEAALVRYRMLSGRHLELGSLRYLAAELFALAALMRAVAVLGQGLVTLPQSLELWVRYPLEALDTPFIICLAVGVVVALLARGGMRELAALEPGPGGRPPEVGIAADTLRAEAENRAGEALRYIASRLGWGALIALVALTAQMIDPRELGAPALPPAPLSPLAGIMYLICAVLLYSRARLGLLRSRWQRDDATVEPAVLQRWRVSSLGLVLAVVAIGILLPRGYGGGVVDVARAGLMTVLQILSLVALFFGAIAMGALGLALTIPALILALFGGFDTGTVLPPALPQMPTPEPPPPPAEPPLAPGLIFWICMAALAGYALWTVLRRQEWVLAAAARLRAGILAPLLAWLGRLWAGVAGYAQIVGEAIAERLRPAPSQPPPGPERPRLLRLDPGALVRHFYASVVLRAERGGVSRRRAETPAEYGEKLRAHIPEAADDVDSLTAAYLEAAYGPRPTTPAKANEARGLWQRLRRALRG